MSFSVLIDKSPQGFIDEDIIPLLTIINNDKRYETTSSCSGRITLMRGVKKGESSWVFKKHQIVEAKDIFSELQKLEDNETLRFIYEPIIIHMKCKTFEDASNLLSLLHTNGIKKSGMISVKNLLIEINDTGKMETILNKDLSYEYIELLVNEANRRLTKTKGKIKFLEELFEKNLEKEN